MPSGLGVCIPSTRPPTPPDDRPSHSSATSWLLDTRLRLPCLFPMSCAPPVASSSCTPTPIQQGGQGMQHDPKTKPLRRMNFTLRGDCHLPAMHSSDSRIRPVSPSAEFSILGFDSATSITLMPGEAGCRLVLKSHQDVFRQSSPDAPLL